MRTVTTVFADFVTSPAGTPSQLRTELAGQPILKRTLERLLQTDGPDTRCLVVHQRDETTAREFLQNHGLTENFDVLAREPGSPARHTLLRNARKWHLEAWRGGLLGATWFDEYFDTRTAAAVLQHYRCEALLCVDGHQPVLDPTLTTTLYDHAQNTAELVPFFFTQAPPGLTGVIITAECLEELLRLTIPFGLLLTYRPEVAQSDPIIRPSCCHVPTAIAQTRARFVADTQRARQRLGDALGALGDDVDADALCAWSRQPDHDRAGPLPIEIELELTTADPLPNTTLRPRGDRVPHRQLDDLATLEQRITEFATCDDRLVVLGGHGDPLQHPGFPEVCRLLRAAGIFGIAVTTPLIDLPESHLEALFAHQIDVLEVLLDAQTAAQYQRVHNADHLATALDNISRIERHRRDNGLPHPIVVPSFTRAAATIEEMEDFYDGWLRTVGAARITGYNEYCGVLPPDTLIPVEPPNREPCRRLRRRMMFLADGTVAPCVQDVAGVAGLDSWHTTAVHDLWRSEALTALRAKQDQLELDGLRLCPTCREWFRP